MAATWLYISSSNLGIIMLKVLLCGPFPPPLGGISIHIQRLGVLLERKGWTVLSCDESKQKKKDTYNIRSFNILRYIKLISASDIVHIHSSIDILRLFHLLAAKAFRKKAIVTLHSWRKGTVYTKLWGHLLSLFCYKLVFVNIETSLKFSIPPSKIYIFPAFIPPSHPQDQLPEAITKFIDSTKAFDKQIVVSNAFRIIEFNGEDLYGLDLCIQAFSDPNVIKRFSLVYVVSDTSINSKKISEYIELIKTQNLEDHILLYPSAIDFYSLLTLANASIRATNTDGDALSIRESIFLNVPCIASDCVARPQETILFENRSAKDLINKLITLPQTPPSISNSQTQTHIEDFYQHLYE